uniref:Uncharacterized protein n=1 Tax=Nicotiana tabacum TaxID=4097 RepID=A0A1S4A1T8_TOBAC|nr:PREDICTED: uncharacterized protein LOC107792830 [Nicotiana tabacum]
MRTPKVDGAHGGEDLFRGYFIRVEAATDLSAASSLLDEAQQALNRAFALHQEAFSKSRVELSRYEADLRGVMEERNAFKILSGQKEEEIKDLQAELLQQKVKRIEQFREEVNMMKAETLGWKESIDHFAAEKESSRAQLSSVENQLRGMKDKRSAQAKKIEELEARLASELAEAKSEAEKAKAEAIVAIYRADAEAAKVQAREIHARGFDLTNEIIKAKEHEDDARALASSDDDDDDGGKSGFENDDDFDGEESSPEEN